MKVLVDRDELRAKEAELEALREEVKAWRAGDGDLAGDGQQFREREAIRMALAAETVRPVLDRMNSQRKPTRQVAQLILMLADKPGHLFSEEFLFSQLTKQVKRGKQVAVMVHYARRVLAVLGAADAIHNAWGRGYFMPSDKAPVVLQILLGDDA
ncbi:helix-turn-helix domain-containing protein [Phenylobacterium sp.]|uniref:helix-turn-helix domain-containing protein n=1 Tax=Phenylobacterium sp. TaxID=1871053 RepID=UPI002FC81CD1